MKLRLYTANSGGSAVWTEDRLVSAGQGVTLTNGLFSVKLGDVTSLPANLFASGELYLEVELPTPATATSSSPSWTEGAMTPRNQMATSAYAYNSETLDGLDSDAFGKLGSANTWSGNNTFNGTLTVSGNANFDSSTLFVDAASNRVGIGTSSPGQMLHLASQGSSDAAILMQAGTATTVIQQEGDTAYEDAQGAAPWANIDGARYEDSFPATSYVDSSDADQTNDATNYLIVKGYGNSVPSNATIVGIEVWIGGVSGSDIIDVGLTSNGTSITGNTYSSQATEQTLGGPTDLWGGVWTPAMVNSPNFGAGVSFTVGGSGISTPVEIDAIHTIVYYTQPSSYTLGVDYSDNNSFKVSSGTSLGTSDLLSITSGGNATFTSTNSSTAAFLVQTNSSQRLFAVDTNNMRVQVGNAFADSTGVALVLDTKNTSGDPTGVDGAMYYNSNAAKFRCYQAGAWMDCSGASLSANNTWSGTNTFNGSTFGIGGAANASKFSVGNIFNVDTTNAGVVTILGNNSGEVSPWQNSSNQLPSGRSYATSVANNGYVYTIGGFNSSYQSTVYYAKLNADGTVGSWSTAANALPAARSDATSVVANGYVYVMGGFDGSYHSTVYYAKLNADGSVGTWRTSSNALPGLRNNATSVVANGYVYVMGGFDGSVRTDTVYYAKLNADGSIGAWSTAVNALPAVRGTASSVVANGYVYVIGGRDASVNQSTVYYAKLNADGSVGAWSTAVNALPATRSDTTSVVANGYVYVMGGTNGSAYSTVYYAKLNADGSVGAWSSGANSLPATRFGATSVVTNGYAYVIGGVNAGNNSTVYYSRLGGVVNVGGSLDLVGRAGEGLTDGGDSSAGSAGGSVTAGNIYGVGSLQIQKQASFADAVTVLGDFSVGNELFAISRGESTVRIGSSTPDSTGIILVLDNKNTIGDPTGVRGAMYYNSYYKRFRCYGETKWVDCRSSAASNTATQTIASTAAETNFTANYGLEADECVPGRMYKVTARGHYSIAANATAPTLNIRIKLGTTILASTGATSLGTAALTSQRWTLDADVVCMTSGATGTVEAQGAFTRHTSAIASVEWAMTPTAATTVNTTTAQNLQVSAQWGVAAATSTITLRTLTINALDNGN